MVSYKPDPDFIGLRMKTMRYVFSRGFRKALLIALIVTTLLLVAFVLLQRTTSYGDGGLGGFGREHIHDHDGFVEDDDAIERRLPPAARRQSSYRAADERPEDTFQESMHVSRDKNRKSIYNNGLHDEHCNPWRDDKINVHLIPHSHDDVGWLKTVDQYYWGDLNYIQNAGVQYIIDSVLSEVARQPDRRFVIVEMAFLFRWWRRQNEGSRNLLRRLLERGQIELICAGWSMADEASVDYVSLIDQHTTGFGFITSEIDPNYRPLMGWQIDPFGHSREVASLFAEMGMNGLFFARLDYQERAAREMQRTSEMIWQLRPKSPELGLSLFTSILPRSNYGPPPGFNFETFTSDQPIMDDPDLDGYNVPMRVAQFEQAMNQQKTQFPSNHLMVTMGMDFNYVNSIPWFLNMDALIRGTNNKSSTYHMLYSTPSCYTKAVYESVKALTNKTDDFFPYADKPQAYWTGYFTSRPSLKRIVRDLVNWYGTTRQLLALSETPIDPQMRAALFIMQDAQGILQHHDAVTGTAKQAVTDDYRKRGSIALDHGRRMSGNVLRELHCGGKTKLETCELKSADSIEFCPLINETLCAFSENHESFSVVVYNPLAESTTTWLRIPVALKDAANTKLMVVDPNGDTVSSDLIPILEDIKSIPTRTGSKATHELVFRASIPPIGSSVYFVQPGKGDKLAKVFASKAFAKSTGASDKDKEKPSSSDGSVVKMEGQTIDNGKLRLTLDDRGRLNTLENFEEKIKVDFTHFLAFYSARGMPAPPSGAYLFNPDSTEPHLFTEEPTTVIVPGEQVVEIHQTYATWAKSIIRVYAGETQLEVQWIAGPIPTETGTVEQLNRAASNQQPQQQGWQWGGGGGVGREVVSVFESSIDNKKLFYTDSNGREMLQRKKDFRESWSLQTTEPVSQNYYPLNSRISTNDTKAQMTVIIDRAQGGTGMRDGQLEVMVHRRLVQDDQLGVGEALQEVENGRPLVATGRHWVMVNLPKNAPQRYRKYSQLVMFPPIAAFSKVSSRDDWLKANLKTMTSLGAAVTGKMDTKASLLPANVHLLTLERDFQDCSLMLRLEHLYEGGEDEKLAQPAKVELEKFVRKLIGKTASSSVTIEEMALGANMPVKDLVRLKWDSTEKGPGMFQENNRPGPPQGPPMGGMPPMGPGMPPMDPMGPGMPPVPMGGVAYDPMMVNRVKRRALKPGAAPEGEAGAKNEGPPKEKTSKALRYDHLGERMLKTWRTNEWQSVTLLPMQIRTFCVRVKQ